MFMGMMKNGGKAPAEPTPEEKYKAMFDAKMSGMQNDVNKARASNFKLPGTKQDDKPREMSKNAKQMMEILAAMKAKKEMKKQKQKVAEQKRIEKKIKREEEAKLSQQNKGAWNLWGGTSAAGNNPPANNNAFWNPWGNNES